jgi:hypothetical protein
VTGQVGQVNQATRRRPHRRPTIVEEIRLEGGMNQSSEPVERWDPERVPCETDDVTRAEFRDRAAQPVTGESRER